MGLVLLQPLPSWAHQHAAVALTVVPPALECKETLADAFNDLMAQEEDDSEACLTSDSNVSFYSEDSFTSSSGSCAFSCRSGPCDLLQDPKPSKQQPSCAAAAIAKACGSADQLLEEYEEANVCPSAYLSTTQAATGLSPVHRATVVDGMVAAAVRLLLSNDSLFLGVALLDRYLGAKPTPLALLQPTAIACLWAAAKYEQLVVPPVAQFALLVQASSVSPAAAGDAASALALAKLLVALEADVLAALDYRLASVATPKAFKAVLMARLAGSRAGAALSRRQLDQVYCMTSYLSEVSLLEYRLLPAAPSRIAAAAFVYAHMLLGLPHGEALRLTGCSHTELAGLLEMFYALHTTLSAALQLGRPYNVSVKYSSRAVRSVAHIPPQLAVEQRAGPAW